MKSKTVILKYLGFILILFTSCENKENLVPDLISEEYEGYQGCVPLSMNRTFHFWSITQGNYTVEADLDYNYNDGRLTSIIQVDEEPNITTDEFIYSGELLDSITSTSALSEKISYHKYAYDSNERLTKLMHVVKYSPSEDYDTISNSEITYGANGFEKIFTLNWGSSRHIYKNPNTNNIDSLKYYDSNGNHKNTIYYEYDNYSNVYLNLNKHRFYNFTNIINSSTNNILKETFVVQGDTTSIHNYEYLYDENDYPSQITMLVNGEIAYVYTIDYTNCD